jgi:tRNA threonylcarbamoyladenosine biosynthesis protein TsaE
MPMDELLIHERLRRGVITASAAETQAIASAFANSLPKDVTLALHGNLGVGKTTFVQGLARGFGVTETVTSPTFNIYTVHRGKHRTLVHLDAYRLDDAQQIETLLLEDFLVSPWCLAIEWPENIADWLPPNALHLDMGITSNEHHTLKLR